MRPENYSGAVLIAICESDGSAFIPLTIRSRHLRNYASQICLPGGLKDSVDQTAEDTALREFQEELGVPKEVISITTTLPAEMTSQKLKIVPFVGTISGHCHFNIQKTEIEAIINIPISFIKDVNHFSVNANPNYPVVTHHHCLQYRTHFIWGITATFLRHFSLYMNSQSGLSH